MNPNKALWEKGDAPLPGPVLTGSWVGVPDGFGGA